MNLVRTSGRPSMRCVEAWGKLSDLVLGGVVGAVIAIVIPATYAGTTRLRQARAVRRQRARAGSTAALSAWMIDYYRGQGVVDDLYRCDIHGHRRRVGFLTTSAWIWRDRRVSTGAVVRLDPTPVPDFAVDRRAIARRRRIGQRIFENPSVTLSAVEAGPSAPLVVQRCGYLPIASTIIAFEDETFRAAFGRGKRQRTPLRDAYLTSVEQAGRLARQPRSLGCVSLVAIRSATGYDFLLSRRSHETVSYGGVYCAVPNFGLEPLEDRWGDRHDLVTLNFVKEFMEELFNYEELISIMASRRADSCWFLELEEARVLVELMGSGAIDVECLGFGFDALNGNGLLALLWIVDDPDYGAELRRSMSLNWEIDVNDQGPPAVEFVDIGDARLEAWLLEDLLHPGTAFALSEAIPRVAARLSSLGPT